MPQADGVHLGTGCSPQSHGIISVSPKALGMLFMMPVILQLDLHQALGPAKASALQVTAA